MSDSGKEPERKSWPLVVAAIAGLAGIGVMAHLNRPAANRDQAGVLEDAGPASGPRRDRPSLAPKPVVGTGPLELVAVVVDGAGEPVEGASVTAEREEVGGRSMQEGSMDAGPGPGVVVGISDSQGNVRLIGLEAGVYRLRVEREGIYTAEVRYVDVPNPGVHLVVARKVKVRGLVVDGGMPAANVHVGLSGDGITGVLSTTTDGRGDFVFDDLAEGVFYVWAWRAERASVRKRVARLGKGPFGTVVLELAPAHIVSGKVIDRNGGAGVVAAIALTPQSPDHAPRFGRSAGDGSFRIEGVPAGRWTAEAYAPGYVSAEAISFEVGRGYRPTLVLTPGGIVSGTVVDQRDGSIEGAVVSLRRVQKQGGGETISEATRRELAQIKAGQGHRSSKVSGQRFIPRGELGVLLGPIPFPPPRGAAAVRVASIVGRGDDPTTPVTDLPVAAHLESRFTTDAQGRFRVTGLTAGRYRVVVTHRDYADGSSAPFTIEVGGEKRDIKVILVPGVLLVGEVSDNHGEPVVGATVVAEVIGDPEIRVMAATGNDGRYTLGPIAADVRVHVSAVGYGTAERKIEIGEPRLSVQRRTEDFKLIRADATLAGKVTDQAGFPVRQAAVIIGAGGLAARPRRGTTDDNGNFTIPRLAPGSYALTVEHADFPPLSTRGKTGESLDLRLSFGGGISGEVRDAHTHGALVGAQVIATGPGKARKSTASGDGGGFELVPLAPGTWTLQVRTPGYVGQSKSVEVKAGGKPREITARDLRVELERGATIAGVVRDENGQRVRAAVVKAGGQSTRTDENGAFRMRDVSTGSITIEARNQDKRGTLDVPLRPGDELVTLEIEIR